MKWNHRPCVNKSAVTGGGRGVIANRNIDNADVVDGRIPVRHGGASLPRNASAGHLFQSVSFQRGAVRLIVFGAGATTCVLFCGHRPTTKREPGRAATPAMALGGIPR